MRLETITQGNLWLCLLHGGMSEAVDWIQPESVDVIMTSPPYKDEDGFSLALMRDLGRLAVHVLKPGGRVFMNFGQLRENFNRPYVARDLVQVGARLGLKAGQTIAWIKSVVIDEKQRGHYQPITMKSPTLNYCWESIFTFYKPPEAGLDRLSIGVPFADKSNMERGSRGSNGDLHCAGDAWFIPYKTTGATKKKGAAELKGAYSYPEEVVERCLKVSDLQPGAVVLDPFVGGGTTVSVARRLGFNSIAVDMNKVALEVTQRAWEGVQ